MVHFSRQLKGGQGEERESENLAGPLDLFKLQAGQHFSLHICGVNHTSESVCRKYI